MRERQRDRETERQRQRERHDKCKGSTKVFILQASSRERERKRQRERDRERQRDRHDKRKGSSVERFPSMLSSSRLHCRNVNSVASAFTAKS